MGKIRTSVPLGSYTKILNGAVLRIETAKTEVSCDGRRGTIKIPPQVPRKRYVRISMCLFYLIFTLQKDRLIL